MNGNKISYRTRPLYLILTITILLFLLLSFPVVDSTPVEDDPIIESIFSVNNVLERGQDQMVSRSSTLVIGDMILAAYTRENGQRNVVCMVASMDTGDTWSDEVQVHEHDDLVRLDLHMWKSGIYLFIMDGHPTIKTDRETYVYSAQLSSWEDIGKAQGTVIFEEYGMNFAVEYDDDYMYLASARSHHIDLIFHRFDGYEWEGPKKMVADGYASSTTMQILNGKLYLFYSRPWEVSAYSGVDGHVRYFTSTDQGSSWQGPFVAMDVYNDLFELCVEVKDEELILFVNRRYSDDILMSRLDPASRQWTEEVTLVRGRGLNPGKGIGYDFSLYFDLDKDIAILAYETEDGKIAMIHSTDGGERWLPCEKSLSLSIVNGRDPNFSRGGDLLRVASKTNGQWFMSIHEISKEDLEDTSGYPLLQEAIPEEEPNPGVLTVIVLVILILLVLISLLIPLIFVVVIIAVVAKGTRSMKGRKKVRPSSKPERKIGKGIDKKHKQRTIIDDDITGVDREEDTLADISSPMVKNEGEQVGHGPRELIPPPIY